MSKVISQIDELIDHHEIDHHGSAGSYATEPARAELAQLRARIAALENDIICAFCGEHYSADDAPPLHYMTCEKSPLIKRIAEQARQLEEARKVIARCSAYIGSIDQVENTVTYRMCDAWLAANAPAPQAEQE